MSLFYLHTQHDGRLVEDPEGADFPGIDAARAEAIAAARDLWSSAMLKSEDLSDRQFVIADDSGVAVLVIPFGEALPDGLRRRLRDT